MTLNIETISQHKNQTTIRYARYNDGMAIVKSGFESFLETRFFKTALIDIFAKFSIFSHSIALKDSLGIFWHANTNETV
jgi:hypothetical protein